jgi:hypothetical protein
MRFVQNILYINFIMSFFTSKKYNTATQIEAFINSLKDTINYEEILKTDPNEFNEEKLCKYISSDNFKEHEQKCLKFFRHHILSRGCLDLSFKKITLKRNHSSICVFSEMNSAKIVLSIYKLMDRIKKGETGGMDVNFFFGEKFNEILLLNSDFTYDDFEKVIGKVNCDLPSKSFFARGKKTKRQRVRKGKDKTKSRRRR